MNANVTEIGLQRPNQSPKSGVKNAPKFTVNLRTLADGSYAVKSCEVIGRDYRNRTSFQTDTTVERVFHEALAQGLNECLSKISQNKEVISLPDLKIEAPGIALAGAHILTSEPVDGSISVIVRFNYFIGSVEAALNETISSRDWHRELPTSIAADVLFDIALPMLDICTAHEFGLFDDSPASMESFLQKIVENSHELRFRAEILKRFINSSETAEAQPKLTHQTNDIQITDGIHFEGSRA
jgi:hypothetical protein